MNQIINTNSPTMTSREIAELTGKRHPDVKRDIENMMRDLAEDVSRTARIYLDSMNREQREYSLDRELTETLLTGYSAPLRRKVIARWRELESAVLVVDLAPTFTVPTTLSGALRLAAEQADVIEAQAAQLAAAAPAVAFVDRYVDATGTKSFRQVCKLIRANENAFREFLLNRKIAYRLNGEWVPTAPHLEAGRFEVKAGTAQANGHAYNSMRFTPKGIHWIAGEFAKHQLAMQHH